MVHSICRCDNAKCRSESRVKMGASLPDGWFRVQVEGPKGATSAELCSTACADAWSRQQIGAPQPQAPAVA